MLCLCCFLLLLLLLLLLLSQAMKEQYSELARDERTDSQTEHKPEHGEQQRGSGHRQALLRPAAACAVLRDERGAEEQHEDLEKHGERTSKTREL